MEWTNTLAVLEQYAIAVRNQYQDNLILHDHIASGKLLNSVECHVQRNDRDITVVLSLDECWKWVENDCKPHFPPISAILQWIQVKPVLPAQTYNGKLPTQEQLAYLIARKIDEVGTKGTHDLQQAVDETLGMYDTLIEDAVTRDVDAQLALIISMF
jgi:hypothetical protein